MSNGNDSSSPAGMDDLERDLRWVDEKEAIDTLRTELGKDLDDLPADIGSDIALARFIRGKKGELRTDFVRSALQYRRELIQREDVAKYRSTISAETLPDRQNNPYIGSGTEGRSALIWRGWAKDGMPVRGVSVRALLNAAKQAPDEENVLKASDLEEEATALFLHKCSEKQQKMVKAWMVIDFCGANVMELLMGIVPLVKKSASKHSDHYVETTYRILLLNAPSAISALVSAVSVALNARQRSKIVTLAAPTPLTELAVRFEPETVMQIISALEASNIVDSMSSTLAPGHHEFIARRAKKGNVIKWSVEVDTDLVVSHAFLTSSSTPEFTELRIEGDGRGNLEAPDDGVWCICLNNYECWQTTKTIDVNIAIIEM